MRECEGDEKRELRQRCQKLERLERRGPNTPTLVTRIREEEGTRTSRSNRRAEAFSGVVKTPGTSVMHRGSLGVPRSVPNRESDSSEPGTYGERVFGIVQVADVGETHRAQLAPRVRKGSWSKRR